MMRKCNPLPLRSKMLRRLTPLILPGLLLVQCAPAGPVTSVPLPEKARIQKNAEPVVRTQAQLDAAFASWTATAQNPINFRLEGELKGKWRQLISESTWGEYARRCTTAFMETGHVSLTLEYRDYVRLRAALRNSAFRATLSADEEKVLQLVEQRVRQTLKPGMSDVQKTLALHDALVLSSRYEAEGGCNIADILRGGSGSCEAYSAALCVMAEVAGIPCRVVTGSAGGPHAWNLVQLGGKWYHVDATWDDPVIGTGARQELSHAYFCLSDAEISRTHSWNRAAYPPTGAASAAYYRLTNTYFTSFDAYWRAAMAACRRGEKSFEGYLTTYGSPAQFQRNMQRAASATTPRQLRWTGPDTASGPVILSFGH